MVIVTDGGQFPPGVARCRGDFQPGDAQPDAGLPTHAHESALVGQHNELGPVP